MQSMHRRLGKLRTRTADESQVSVLLKDFDDADKMLTKIVEAAKAWRDAWRDILGTQQRLLSNFDALYAPIIGANEEYQGHVPVITPQSITDRTSKIAGIYEELRNDLLEELNNVEARIIRPATEAKQFMHPLKKVMKKREDKKLDFERYQNRVDSGRKKTKRTEKDNASLEKAETELIRAKEEYLVADDHLRNSLPPVITAAFSLLPNLLASQIMIQNTLLAQYYTVLHDFCDEENFPNPSPPASQILSTWDSDFKPVKQQVETQLACIANGKTVRQPMRIEDPSHGSVTGLNIRNGISANRRPSTQSTSLKPLPPASPAISASSGPPSPDSNTRPRISSVPSQTALSLATPNYNSSAMSSPSPADPMTSHAPAGPRADYFHRDRLPSNSSMASIAAKKKPPPPPPPKRQPSSQSLWVKALYEFAGEGQGDLAFKEGDRIRVVKKTESTDDWWEGELKGVQGSFPANYCQPV